MALSSNWIRLQALCLRQKDAGPLGIGKLSENCQHVGGVPITSGASEHVRVHRRCAREIGFASPAPKATAIFAQFISTFAVGI